MSEPLENAEEFVDDHDEDMEEAVELEIGQEENVIEDDFDDNEEANDSPMESGLDENTDKAPFPNEDVKSNEGGAISTGRAATEMNSVDAPFTQDSIRNTEYSQDTLEPEYDEDDDDEDDERRDNIDDQGLDEDIAVTDNVGGMVEGTQEDDDDTSADEVDGGDETDKNSAKLEDEVDVKSDVASSKSNQTKLEVTSYSTRGRTQEENNFDRLAAVGDLLSLGASHRDAATTSLLHSPETRIRESFLSDSLTDEERRTRTRYLPSVDGMHALRKQEIKNDLALARSTLSSSGVTEKLARPGKRKSPDDEMSGVEALDSATLSGDDAGQSAEEEKGTIGGIVPKTVEIGSTTLNIPSLAFVAPSLDSCAKKATPREVDVVVAFNPPRPPESIGAKKKHRMLRWERRPSDIESDLTSYRKTVQKTREELKSAEGELERIRVVDNQLRRHFLQHTQLLKSEIDSAADEIAIVQQECIDMADLPSSRTRTRGAFKGTNAMKDVLYTLRAKGKEIETKGLTIIPIVVANNTVSGAGGVTASSFIDWNRSATIEPSRLADAWVVPGEKVKTPYGHGTVHSVYGPSSVNTTEPPNHDLFPRPNSASVSTDTSDAMEVDDSENQSVTSKKKAPKPEKKIDSGESTVTLINAIAPRVAVRLPFGVAFFNLASIKSEDHPTTFTDDQLAKRWLGIAETAASFGATVNVSAMTSLVTPDKSEKSATEKPMDLEKTTEYDNVDHKNVKKLIPFGAGMLPTAVGRGTNLHKTSLVELDEAVNKTFFKGHGALGNKDNLGVPNDVRNLEDQRQDHLNLQAKVLQLRNQLYRQRRIRILNERTYVSSQERASKVESLVTEMRIDLKSLKGRLDLEIRELGMTEEQAENILKSFYMSQDSQVGGDISSPSRPRFSQLHATYEDQEIPMEMETAADTDASITAAEQ